MPVTAEPDGASALICHAPASFRSLAWEGVQLAPVAEVHTATLAWPGAPKVPAAVKPAASAVSAVKAVLAPGELKGLASYDNEFSATPQRVVEFTFESLEEAGRYFGRKEISWIFQSELPPCVEVGPCLRN